ncbi:unnamed protein product [Alopecurus aequalis]
MATKELSIKLLVDTKAQKVCFAEAGGDTMEFLSSILSLPLGTVANLLPKELMVGSIANVLGSVEKLDANYKSMERRLSPAVAPATLSRLQQLLGSHLSNGNINFFTCKGHTPSISKKNDLQSWAYCICPRASCGYLSVTSGIICDICGSLMDKPMTVAVATGANADPEVYVEAATTYTIMDDLSVTPASNLLSGITLLAQRGVKDISALEEKTVKIGKEEALAILVASLKSKTVLTDVFLPKKNARCKREHPEEVIQI